MHQSGAFWEQNEFMDTSLNTHMKQNFKQIFFFFMDILQITHLLNYILVLLSYSIS